MKRYNMRRKDKMIKDESEILKIIKEQKYLTIAMCKDNEPYLVSLNYVFIEEERCFYFHCATKGKKIDFLKSNPLVWGQVLEDNGYLIGECDYNFRSVHFTGDVEFIQEDSQKINALKKLIIHFEPDPEPMIKKFLIKPDMKTVGIGKIKVKEWFGKGHKEKEE